MSSSCISAIQINVLLFQGAKEKHTRTDTSNTTLNRGAYRFSGLIQLMYGIRTIRPLEDRVTTPRARKFKVIALQNSLVWQFPFWSGHASTKSYRGLKKEIPVIHKLAFLFNFKNKYVLVKLKKFYTRKVLETTLEVTFAQSIADSSWFCSVV